MGLFTFGPTAKEPHLEGHQFNAAPTPLFCYRRAPNKTSYFYCQRIYNVILLCSITHKPYLINTISEDQLIMSIHLVSVVIFHFRCYRWSHSVSIWSWNRLWRLLHSICRWSYKVKLFFIYFMHLYAIVCTCSKTGTDLLKYPCCRHFSWLQRQG